MSAPCAIGLAIVGLPRSQSSHGGAAALPAGWLFRIGVRGLVVSGTCARRASDCPSCKNSQGGATALPVGRCLAVCAPRGGRVRISLPSTAMAARQHYRAASRCAPVPPGPVKATHRASRPCHCSGCALGDPVILGAPGVARGAHRRSQPNDGWRSVLRRVTAVAQRSRPGLAAGLHAREPMLHFTRSHPTPICARPGNMPNSLAISPPKDCVDSPENEKSFTRRVITLPPLPPATPKSLLRGPMPMGGPLGPDPRGP